MKVRSQRLNKENGEEKEMEFTQLDQYLFGQGKHYEIYKKLGAHPTSVRRKKGVYFAVCAPNSKIVSVVG